MKMCGSATAYIARAKWTSPLFSALYEMICHDLGVVPSGTNQHKEMMFNDLEASEAFTAKGSRVALRRWFSWCDSFRFFDKVWHSRLLALIMFGMSCGLYHDFTEVPLWRMEGDGIAPNVDDGDDEDEAAERDEARAVQKMWTQQ